MTNQFSRFEKLGTPDLTSQQFGVQIRHHSLVECLQDVFSGSVVATLKKPRLVVLAPARDRSFQPNVACFQQPFGFFDCSLGIIGTWRLDHATH